MNTKAAADHIAIANEFVRRHVLRDLTKFLDDLLTARRYRAVREVLKAFDIKTMRATMLLAVCTTLYSHEREQLVDYAPFWDRAIARAKELSVSAAGFETVTPTFRRASPAAR